jgi:hypothetical protein
MLREQVCTSCDGALDDGQHRFPPLVFNRRGSALCNHCAHVSMDAPLDDAIRIACIQDNYSFVETSVAEGACFERAFAESDPPRRATHVYVRQDGTCVVAYIKAPGRTAPQEKLASLFFGPPPNILPDPRVLRFRTVPCSFCRRGQRSALLVSHKERRGKRPALTYCAECLFVACDLFRQDGVLPTNPVRHGEFTNNERIWREVTRVWHDPFAETSQKGGAT